MICPSCKTDNDEAAEHCIACGKGLFALTRGTVLAGRYEILDALGRGGMGMVYKARDRELDETVAVKVLRANVSGSSDLARRFRSEIKLARRVTHPNVCRIHEYGKEGHLSFIVMEFVDGVDLRQELREGGPLPWRTAFATALEVARGLEAVHRVGIVHRDLKTANLMRCADGSVRLMDFGIAKRLDAEESSGGGTTTGHTVGTPEYMSPEQAFARDVDAHSDIYAFGVVLFELFTGEVPFRGAGPAETLMKHVHEKPPLEGPRAARLPFPVVAILRKALAKKPEDRYATVGALIEDLERARSRAGEEAAAAIGPHAARALKPHEATVATLPRAAPAVMGPTMLEGAGASAQAVSQAPARRRLGLLALGTLGLIAGLALLARGRGPARVELTAPVRAPAPTQASQPGPGLTPPMTASPTVPTSSPPQARRDVPLARLRLEGATSPPPRREPTPAPTLAATAPTPSPATEPRGSTAEEISSTPSPVAEEAASQQATGLLQLRVLPWAEVSVDGTPMGSTPLRPLSLPVGDHVVRLSNPDYRPLQKKVTIVRGQTTRLEIDLAAEAFPR